MEPAAPTQTGTPSSTCRAGSRARTATKLLADGGAEVVKVEAPEGDPLRAVVRVGGRHRAGRRRRAVRFPGLLEASVVADPDVAADTELVERLLASADAVVWSRGSAVAEHGVARPPSDPPSPSASRSSPPITPFGLDGPWHDRPATEFTLQAWSGGAIGIGRGSQDRAPVHVGGQVGDWVAGAYAAAMTLAFRARALRDGHGELIDLSMLEAQILCLTYYPVTFFEMLGRPWRTERRPTVPGVAQAEDGLVALGCGTAQQWFDLCAMSGHDEWIDETVRTHHHRAGQPARRGTLRVVARPAGRRRPRARVGVPHPQLAGGQRRERHGDGPLRRARRVHDEPAGRLRAAEPSVPAQRRHACGRRRPRRGSASTPTHDRSAGADAATRADRQPGPRPAAVQRSSRARHDDVLGGAVVHPRARRCSARS